MLKDQTQKKTRTLLFSDNIYIVPQHLFMLIGLSFLDGDIGFHGGMLFTAGDGASHRTILAEIITK